MSIENKIADNMKKIVKILEEKEKAGNTEPLVKEHLVKFKRWTNVWEQRANKDTKYE